MTARQTPLLLLLGSVLVFCGGACKCAGGPVGAGGRPPEAVALVRVAYPGASPSEVEAVLALPLEEAVSGLNGLSRVESHCSEGQLVMEVAAAGPPAMAAMWIAEVREALVPALASLPQDAERPLVFEGGSRAAGLVVLAGDLPPAALAELGERLQQSLERVADLRQVMAIGATTPLVRVTLDPARLSAFGSNPRAVERALTTALVARSGVLPAAGDEVLIRVGHSADPSLEDLRQMLVFRTADGRPVTLADLADIALVEERGPVRVVSSAGPALALALGLSADPQAETVWSRLSETLLEFAAQAPPSLRLSTWVLAGPAAPPLVAVRLGWPETADGEMPDRIAAGLDRALSGVGPIPSWVSLTGRPALGTPFAGWQGVLLALPPEATAAGAAALSDRLGAQLRTVPGLAVSVAPLPVRRLPAATLHVLVQGPEPAAQVRAVAEALGRVPGVAAVWPPVASRPELNLQFDRARLATLGVSLVEATRSLRLALSGQRIGSVRAGGRSVPLELRLAGKATDPDRLATLPLATPAGQRVTLGQVARLERRLAPAEIQRLDGQRTVQLDVELSEAFDEARRQALLTAGRAALAGAPPGTRIRLR